MLAAAARCASGAQARLAGSARQGRSLFTAVPIARRGRATAQGVSVACRAPQFASIASRHAVATPGPARAFAAEAGQGLGATKREDEIFMATERKVRNLCVIAHVDHGKTSLTDKILKQADPEYDSTMDSNPLEKERGITIFAKVTSLNWKDHVVNVVDTPGHADFGSEVQRILQCVDGCLLLVDALEGPMPQTRYVLQCALRAGLHPIVVFNKCDREGARIGEVESDVFDLFVQLDATESQLDFPIVYASAREGWTAADAHGAKSDMSYLLDVILDKVPPPKVLGGDDAPFKMLASQMEFDSYVGKLIIGRVQAGTVKTGDPVVAMTREGLVTETGKITKMFARRGSTAIPMDRAVAGDIIQIAGLQTPLPTSTIAAPSVIRPLFADPIDPPTISMNFGVNDSLLAGKDGTKLTASMILERLEKEARTNVGLEIASSPPQQGMSDAAEVRARGELSLAVLIETMRREGFELSVSPPAVLFKTTPSGERQEPYEHVVVDVDDEFSGAVIDRMAARKGVMIEFHALGKSGKSRLSFRAPSRGLIGFQSDLKTDTRGTATVNRVFDSYGPYIRGMERKPRAAMVSMAAGQITAYALDSLQSRGRLFVAPGHQTYVGHIIGECSRDSLYDMDVNPVKGKKLTNIRAAGNDEAVRLPPPRIFSLEDAVVYVAPDELVEVTPAIVRLRKRILDPNAREQFSRAYARSVKDLEEA